MNHKMPVLTSEQLENRIEWASRYIDTAISHCAHHPQDESAKAHLDLLKIALASLTAEPEDGLFIRGTEVSPIKGRRTISQATPMPNGEFHHSCFKMYTAPPVPVMQAVKLLDGWKLVPVEPTQAMIDAHTDGMITGGATKAYREMMAVAPVPEQ